MENFSQFIRGPQSSSTYSRPMANRSTTLILCLVGIRNFQTALAGSIRMKISESILNKQIIRMSISLSIQSEPVTRAFQIASCGEQAKMVIKAVIQ